MFGTINWKSAAAGSNAASGWMFPQRSGDPLIERKLTAGLCLRTYSPGPSGPSVALAPVKQGPAGRFSANTRHVLPAASSWSAMLGAETSWTSSSNTSWVDPLNTAR